MSTTPLFTADAMGLLRECAAVLVHAEPGAPAFDAADPDGEFLAMAAELIGPRLGGILAELQSMDGGATKDRLDALEREHPGAFTELRDLLICCYLSTPQVWQLLGYAGRTPRPAGPGEAEEWLRDGILDPVVSRGPIYVSPPSEIAQLSS